MEKFNDYHFDEVVRHLVEIRKEVEKDRQKFQNAFGLSETTGFKPLHQVKGSLKTLYSLEQPSYSYSPKRKVDVVEKLARDEMEALAKEIAEVEELNKPIIESNNALYNQIAAVMESIGIKKTYTTSEYKTARSRSMTTTTHTAGFVNDLNRVKPTSNTEAKKQAIKSREAELTRYVESKKREEAEAKQKEYDAEMKKVLNVPELITILAKHDVNIVEKVKAGAKVKHVVSDTIYKIIAKDKYLYLAYYLEKNRGDWSDGSDYAETGLDGFTIETEEDQKIYDEIHGLIEDWDGDGRCFRDCTYNYDVLYSMVDHSLHIDLQELAQYED